MFFYLLLSIFLGWLIILTYYVIQTRKHYFRLTQRSKKQRIDDILEKLIEDDERNSQDILQLSKEIEKFIGSSTVFYKKLGLVRFDPFGRTEGDKSFVLSMLDGKDNGFIMNFIYTHEGIRVYAKKIKEGKGEEYELSEEEKKAIEKAN